MNSIDKAKRAEFIKALQMFQYNVSAACKHMGIARSTFYRNITKLNLEGYANFDIIKTSEVVGKMVELRGEHTMEYQVRDRSKRQNR